MLIVPPARAALLLFSGNIFLGSTTPFAPSAFEVDRPKSPSYLSIRSDFWFFRGSIIAGALCFSDLLSVKGGSFRIIRKSPCIDFLIIMRGPNNLYRRFNDALKCCNASMGDDFLNMLIGYLYLLHQCN
jgi:hypothetical protein